jgi:hypothetical protein
VNLEKFHLVSAKKVVQKNHIINIPLNQKHTEVKVDKNKTMKQNINEIKRIQQLAGVVNENQQPESLNVRQLVREAINEVIKSGVREMWADIKDALANARIVTVDGVEIDKAISGAGAVRGVDGKIFRIQTPEYLSQPDRIKIEDVNGEMKSPVITLYSDTELDKIAQDYNARKAASDEEARRRWMDRYGPNGGYETAFGRYTGD